MFLNYRTLKITFKSWFSNILFKIEFSLEMFASNEQKYCEMKMNWESFYILSFRKVTTRELLKCSKDWITIYVYMRVVTHSVQYVDS